MRLSRRSLLLVAAGSLVLAGCEKKKSGPSVLRGSGVQARKTRDIPQFSRLKVGDRLHATVKLGAHGPMELKGDDNLLEHVRARIEDGVLVLDMDTKVKGTMPLELRLSTPELALVSGVGVSRIYIEGLKAKHFEGRVAGASNMFAEGTAETLALFGKDVTKFDFSKVTARSAKIELVKAGNAETGYLEELDVKIAGASRVIYRGDPVIKQEIERPAVLVKRR